jgi:hypothetical protein
LAAFARSNPKWSLTGQIMVLLEAIVNTVALRTRQVAGGRRESERQGDLPPLLSSLRTCVGECYGDVTSRKAQKTWGKITRASEPSVSVRILTILDWVVSCDI